MLDLLFIFVIIVIIVVVNITFVRSFVCSFVRSSVVVCFIATNKQTDYPRCGVSEIVILVVVIAIEE